MFRFVSYDDMLLLICCFVYFLIIRFLFIYLFVYVYTSVCLCSHVGVLLFTHWFVCVHSLFISMFLRFSPFSHQLVFVHLSVSFFSHSLAFVIILFVYVSASVCFCSLISVLLSHVSLFIFIDMFVVVHMLVCFPSLAGLFLIACYTSLNSPIPDSNDSHLFYHMMALNFYSNHQSFS